MLLELIEANNLNALQHYLTNESPMQAMILVEGLHKAMIEEKETILTLLMDHLARDVVTKKNVFLIAIDRKYAELVNLLLEQSKDLNLQDIANLERVIQSQDIAVLEVLLQHGAKANVDNSEVYTAPPPLDVACEIGHLPIVKLLVAYGADVNDGLWDTFPINIAVKYGHLHVVQFLIKSHAELAQYEPEWQEPMSTHACITAARYGHQDLLEWFINNHYTAVDDIHYNYDDSGDSTEVTMLMAAACYGQLFMVRWLCETQSADINKQNPMAKTALSFACQFNQVEVVEYLLSKQALTDIPNAQGDTPLLLASRCGYANIMSLLIQFNANLEHANLKGNTPLMLACQEKAIYSVILLLSHGAMVTKTILKYALKSDSINHYLVLPLLELLLEHDIDVGKMHLLNCQHAGAVSLLLSRGVAPHNLYENKDISPSIYRFFPEYALIPLDQENMLLPEHNCIPLNPLDRFFSTHRCIVYKNKKEEDLIISYGDRDHNGSTISS